VEKSTETFNQYVILGAGLDTFAQRRSDMMTKVQLFEVDRAETQAWKRERLLELGYTIPESLHFVPIDFEGNVSLINELEAYGFDRKRPALFAATGVSQYITKGAICSLLQQVARLPAGATMAMTFLLPFGSVE